MDHQEIITLKLQAMLFTNFSSEASDSFKIKYHETAQQYRGNGMLFLLGDVEASQGAFQVSRSPACWLILEHVAQNLC